MKTKALFQVAIILWSLALVISGLSEPVAERPPAGATSDQAQTEPNDLFLHKVHPLLEARCFGCHGEPKDREGDLDMRTREGLLKGGESGKSALIPGQPEQSPMFLAVLRQAKLKMPPKEKNQLTADEIDLLRQWIAA